MAKAKRKVKKSSPLKVKSADIRAAYKAAKARYAELGVDVDAAVRATLKVPVSLHCWQADDVKGLEVLDEVGSGGGIMATGNYPGAARTGDEMRKDFDFVSKLIPGKLRFNLHAIYAETGGKKVSREKLTAKHFDQWIGWAKQKKFGLDFNPTCFGHPRMKNGMTLSSDDAGVRKFWIEHCRASRRIAGAMAKALGSCTCNIWIPDGTKDEPADRWAPRARLEKSLDAVLDRPVKGVVDAVESKLFGIGCEAYTVGSHEFYLMYAAHRKNIAVCYDLGHFHPTESIADKISSTLPHFDHMLMHVSRGIRWDSDHIAVLNKDVQDLCDEVVRGNAMKKAIWALDFFDASVNRVAAYVIGTRALRKGLLRAYLEPTKLLKQAEREGKGAQVLALQEHRLELPFSAVWDYLCLTANSPVGIGWVSEMENYENRVLAKRC